MIWRYVICLFLIQSAIVAGIATHNLGLMSAVFSWMLTLGYCALADSKKEVRS